MMFSKSFKQIHHHGRQVDIPKGCVAIKVGHGEEQERFTVPVNYINHPFFVHLLKEAEEEYGFSQQGTITIPCQLKEFKVVPAVFVIKLNPFTTCFGCNILKDIFEESLELDEDQA
ncbi:unnamed protein product [Lathyrus oleraceus]|uniref:Uncharacterized protein n=1 Tax=Pisum sativum TaxID=3888 RepID=A0A9D4XNM8_PEA|nr:hypothetical protein KIW84_030085 [Pisum sativum]